MDHQAAKNRRSPDLSFDSAAPMPLVMGPEAEVAPFLRKLYDMVEDPETDAVVSWSNGNNSFVIWDPHAFARDLLPKHFKHDNLSSFVRQANTYGFRKVDPDRYEFANDGFLRGQKHLLKTIVRRKASHNAVSQQQQQQQPQQPLPLKQPLQGKKASVNACVEVGKFGLEEEVEILKRDKNVLMQELVKLRQHQQNSNFELQNVLQRLKMMEQNQQQMMSLLAMAINSPSFLAQLQQLASSKWRNDANKRRRYPALEHADAVQTPGPSGGQIIKYNPAVAEVVSSPEHQISQPAPVSDVNPVDSMPTIQNNGSDAVGSEDHDGSDRTVFQIPSDAYYPADYMDALFDVNMDGNDFEFDLESLDLLGIPGEFDETVLPDEQKVGSNPTIDMNGH